MLCFFFNDTATTEIYTLPLHDALPIPRWRGRSPPRAAPPPGCGRRDQGSPAFRSRRSSSPRASRSEEHTSELQSRQYLVCRLLLEKKNPNQTKPCIRRYDVHICDMRFV